VFSLENEMAEAPTAAQTRMPKRPRRSSFIQPASLQVARRRGSTIGERSGAQVQRKAPPVNAGTRCYGLGRSAHLQALINARAFTYSPSVAPSRLQSATASSQIFSACDRSMIFAA